MATAGAAIVRLAVPDDLKTLLDIDAEARSGRGQPATAAGRLEPDTAHYFSEWIAEKCCVIAEVGGAVAGFGVMHYHFFHSGMIDLVIVREPCRCRGIGRAIVRHLAERCTSPKVWISTNLSNTPMQALLAAEGFGACGFIDGLDESDPELIYSRPGKSAAAKG